MYAIYKGNEVLNWWMFSNSICARTVVVGSHKTRTAAVRFRSGSACERASAAPPGPAPAMSLPPVENRHHTCVLHLWQFCLAAGQRPPLPSPLGPVPDVGHPAKRLFGLARRAATSICGDRFSSTKFKLYRWYIYLVGDLFEQTFTYCISNICLKLTKQNYKTNIISADQKAMMFIQTTLNWALDLL